MLFLAEDEETGEATWQYRGNSSEAPIVVAARKIGLPENVTKGYRRIVNIPFSSARKMMLTVSDVTGRTSLCDGGMPLPPGTTGFTVCKGAPNWVIQSCSSILREDGGVYPLSEEEKARINAGVVDAYSDQALRVLAVAVGFRAEPTAQLENDDVPLDDKFNMLRRPVCVMGNSLQFFSYRPASLNSQLECPKVQLDSRRHGCIPGPGSRGSSGVGAGRQGSGNPSRPKLSQEQRAWNKESCGDVTCERTRSRRE